MQKRWVCIAAVCVMSLAVCAGCGKKEKDAGVQNKGMGTPATAKAMNGDGQDELVVTGMYLTYGEDEDSYIFVEEENKQLFYVPIPDENLFDENGEEISQEDLSAGDVIAMYGSDMVAESYPLQYLGVTRMERTKAGTAQDAEKYQDLIDQIYSAPDASEIPYLSIENKQEMANATTAINSGGFEWSYVDENGETQNVVADAMHVLEWKRADSELVTLNCNTDDKDLLFVFSKKPQSVNVTRWDDTATIADADKGEKIEVELDGKKATLKDAVPGSIYQVDAQWKNGRVTYGFAVK